jgi:hypothetical protein
MRECRTVRHPVSPVQEWTKMRMPEPVRYRNNGTQTGTGKRGHSPVPECSCTGLRYRMPECRCRRHRHRWRCPATQRKIWELLVLKSAVQFCKSPLKAPTHQPREEASGQTGWAEREAGTTVREMVTGREKSLVPLPSSPWKNYEY